MNSLQMQKRLAPQLRRLALIHIVSRFRMDVPFIAPQTKVTFHLHPHERFRGLHAPRLPHLRRVPRKLLTQHPVPSLRLLALIVPVFPPNLPNIVRLTLHLLQQDLTQVRLVECLPIQMRLLKYNPVASLVRVFPPTLQSIRLRDA